MPTVKKWAPPPEKAPPKKITGSPTQTSSVLDRIAPIEFDDEGIRIMLYGKSGTGKTTLWATFPKPILAVICSGSSRPGELRSVNTAEYQKTIRQVVLEKSVELATITEAIRDGQLEYPTIILDHASGLQDMVLKEILGLEELPAQKGWGMASQQRYGQCTLQCKELLRGLISVKGNVVIVAQEREFNAEGGDSILTPYVGAGLTPSLTGWLNTAVDYICQTFIREEEETKETTVGQGKAAKTIRTRVKTGKVEYCLRTAPHPVYSTKFRVPRGGELPPVLVDPSYSKIMDVVNQLVEAAGSE